MFLTEPGGQAVGGTGLPIVFPVHAPADKTTSPQVLHTGTTGSLQADIVPNLGKVVPSAHLRYGKIEDIRKPIKIAERSIVSIISICQVRPLNS